jgi:redox-sensitive bicupin YhaK (pirin superfamily)
MFILYATILEPGERVVHQLPAERHAWIHVARGAVRVNDMLLRQGDGAAISVELVVNIEGVDEAEVLLFDLG